jgi:hypothetical protein
MAAALAAAIAGHGRAGGPGRGITLALTAATGVQRFLGWLIATSGALNTVVAGWQLWRVWSDRGGPPPRH